MWNVVVFAVIGLLAGTAARMFYPGRQPLRIVGTMLLGVVGAVAGGMISWLTWPLVEGEFHSGSLLMSLLGAGVVIVAGAVVVYSRRLSGARGASR